MAAPAKKPAAKVALPPVRIMTRTVGTGMVPGVQAAEQVELDLENYYAQGYELMMAQFMGMVPNGVMILFILVLKSE